MALPASTKHGMAAPPQEVQDLRTETGGRDDALSNVVESDSRILFGAMITAALGLAALMARGFH